MANTAPSKLCFIVGPIGEKGTPVRNNADFLRRYIIRPAMADFPDFQVVRADEIGTPGMIDSQIITRLRDADLVIADLATSNPNAFYEIGIRHMVSKPIVHMRRVTEKIPFDVTLFSAVTYDLDSVEGHDAAIQELKRHVAAAVDPNHDVDNPVTRTLGKQHFNQTALPELSLVRAELDSLRNSIQPLIASRRAETTRAIVDALSEKPTVLFPDTPSVVFGDNSSRNFLLEAIQRVAKKDRDDPKESA